MKNAISPWSYSKYKSFDTCPRQFYHLKLVKDYVEPETSAMSYGTDVHLALEEYVRDGKPVPTDYEKFLPTVDALMKKDGVKLPEIKLGLTADLKPCAFDAEDVWYRGIADLVILDEANGLAWVVDYKTGKSAKYADEGQLELMALAIFALYPEVKTIRSCLLFLVSREIVKRTYKDTDINDLWGKWLGNYSRLETAFVEDVWNPKPSGLCRKHCLVTECPHNGNN